MTDLDLTTAAQSIASSLAVDFRDQESLALIQAAVDAAAPVIERQVRERIAADIRDMPDRHDDVAGARRLGYEWGRADAIYVARGGVS